MKVLVACEFSGIVREAFKAKGHDAWSCDLLPTEIESNRHHLIGDARRYLNNQWDLLIAHPPCTYLSNAGAKHLYPKGILNIDRYKLGIEATRLFMDLYNADDDYKIPLICIENPIPSKIYDLPKYSQIIQPYEYGHPFQKKTCLWLKGLPNLTPTNIVNERENTRLAGNWFNKGGKDRQKNRAKTFQGIADAMAEQWGKL